MYFDKYYTPIKVGQKVRTNEAGWYGTVHMYKDTMMYIGWPELAKPDQLVIIDDEGGFSLEPEWDKCEVIEEV